MGIELPRETEPADAIILRLVATHTTGEIAQVTHLSRREVSYRVQALRRQFPRADVPLRVTLDQRNRRKIRPKTLHARQLQGRDFREACNLFGFEAVHAGF